jgi:hypothetical protein
MEDKLVKFLPSQSEVQHEAGSAGGRQNEVMITFEEGIKEMNGRICRVEKGQDDQNVTLSETDKRLTETEELTSMLENQIQELMEDWPKLNEEVAPWKVKIGKQAKREENRKCKKPDIDPAVNESHAKVSFEEKYKDIKEGKFLIIGDSLAREIGNHLNRDNTMFAKLDFDGSKIEDLTDKIRIIGERPENHAVVVIGTNNLIQDTTEPIMRKYEKLIDVMKEQKYKNISIVGILKRSVLSNYMESKRIGLNERAKILCEQKGAGFLDVNINRDTMLDRKGVHLNYRGQDKVARAVFKHCIGSLNG